MVRLNKCLTKDMLIILLIMVISRTQTYLKGNRNSIMNNSKDSETIWFKLLVTIARIIYEILG